MIQDDGSRDETRVGLIHLRLNSARFDAFRKDRPERFLRIRRRRWFGTASATVAMLSGTSLDAHGVDTWLVPGDGPSDALLPSASGERFRYRRSNETNRPLLMHRLLAGGIESVAVGSRFGSSGVDGVHEVDARVLANAARLRKVSMQETAFEAIEEARVQRERSRFHLLSLDLSPVRTIARESEEEHSTHVGGDDGVELSQSLPPILRRFKDVSSLDHLLVVYSANGVEWLSYDGRRELGMSGQMAMSGAVVATIFDLFGLARPIDVVSGSILEVEADAELETSAAGISWEVDPIAEIGAPDLSGTVAAAVRGDGGPLTRAVGQEKLRAAWEGAYDSLMISDLVDLARDLVAISENPMALFRLCLSLSMQKKPEEFRGVREKLHTSDPDSSFDRLVDLLPVSRKSDLERMEILERNPLASFTEPHLRGLWIRTAIMLGRIDDGLNGLWKRILGDWASHRECVVFAAKSIERNKENDCDRARVALLRCIPSVSSPERRSSLVRLLAESHVKSGRPKRAIAVLEAFLGRFPGEMGATGMLNGLRRQFGE